MTVVIETGATDTQGINILHQNRFNGGTVTWSSETTGGEGVNTLDPATWNVWRPASVPASQTLDFGSSLTCNGACIAAHDGWIVGSTYLIQYSNDNVNWTTASSHAPLTSETIFMLFPSTSARYWRFMITGAVCSVAVVMIGNRYTFPNGPVSGHVPFHHAWQSEMLTNESDSGELLGNRVVKTGARFSVNVGSVQRDLVENSNLFTLFERHFNNGRAFAYCGSPEYTPKDCAYCWRDGDTMSISWVEGDELADVSFNVRAYVHV
jgi:hypothetical protein